MQIANKTAPEYQLQKKTQQLISSFLNEIVQNVTKKAKENAESTRKKTITYIDVMVATMNLFGEDNKWIERIMKRGLNKSREFEDKIGYSIPKNGRDPADDISDDVLPKEEDD